MKVTIQNKYEVEVLDILVENFLKTTGLSLETHLTHFIQTDIDFDIDIALTTHTKEQISKILNQCLIEDLCLKNGPFIYDLLDKNGYNDYEKW